MHDSLRLTVARGLRGFADGAVSVVLPAYLLGIGLSQVQVGAIATATLVGSALLTLCVGLAGGRFAARQVLLASCALLALTGLGFASQTALAPLLLVAFVGTMNPTAGDVSIFLPTEQALLAESPDVRERTATFARYNVAGALLGAAGSLAAGLPELAARRFGVPLDAALRAVFVSYAAVALPLVALYLGLGSGASAARPSAARAPLARSRKVVLRLTALFAIDSFGGGFAVQSMLALWLAQRFGLSLAELGSFFFAASTLSAFSQFLSARLAARIGLVETMVFTHLPANLFLIASVFMPTAPLALGCLLVRGALSQMDVPARQSYVMAVVPPEERAAAASVTNVPRALASALAPLLTGAMLQHSSFGWPLICAGSLKIAYDLLLLWQFRAVPPHALEPRANS
ncbi:MAG TPA: MFS transporter [Myxococcota bacterium]|nr:MFS transporter [Myxococcota bacterium]